MARPRQLLPWRAGLIALLLLALWNPELPGGAPAVNLVVVLDDSLSMGDPVVSQGWSRIAEAARELPRKSLISVVRYGTNSEIEIAPGALAGERIRALLRARSPPRRLAVDRTSSNSENALRTALELADGERETIVVLVSDGKDTAGDAAAALRLAKSRGIGTYWFDPRPAAALERDSWIEALQAPEQARVGQRIPITVTLRSSAAVEGRLVVRLDGAVVAETTVAVEGQRPTHAQIAATLERAGALELEVAFEVSGDAVPRNNRHTRLVHVEGRAPVLLVSRETRPPAFARGLARGAWSLERIQPSQFPVRVDALRRFSAMVLDDIAISDMSEAAWRALARAVRGAGTGLVVLGGPRSFAAGFYRNSRLEALLPVTAEADQPQGRAAVLFVVDKSGSMDRTRHGVSRFDYAQKATTETVRSLDPDDLVGLIWFDAEAREAIPLTHLRELSGAFDAAWGIQPAGGTVLAPALEAAVARLSEVAAKQRLIILVTDGALSAAEDLEPVRRAMAEAEIEVIALVIGDLAQAQTLRRLVSSGRGRLLRLDEVAELPRLMRSEVELWRTPARLEPVLPRAAQALPFLPAPGTWPPLSGYMVTKARPSAKVYLTSDRGEPLLAMHHVGAARVVALPGGLGAWARAWQRWPWWRALIGGLLEWVSARSVNPDLHARIEDGPGSLDFTVDAVASGGDWLTDALAEVTVLGPAGQSADTTLEQIAPGRFGGRVAVGPTGRYTATLRVGGQTLRRTVLHTADHEFLPSAGPARDLAALVRDDLITAWRPGTDLSAGLERGQWPLRLPLLTVVSVLYILLLIHGRTGWPLGPLRRYLKARLAKLRGSESGALVGRWFARRPSG